MLLGSILSESRYARAPKMSKSAKIGRYVFDRPGFTFKFSKALLKPWTSKTKIEEESFIFWVPRYTQI